MVPNTPAAPAPCIPDLHGVYEDTSRTSCNRWEAAIYHNGRKLRFGWFPTAEAAAVAYDEGVLQLARSDLPLNFVGPEEAATATAATAAAAAPGPAAAASSSLLSSRCRNDRMSKELLLEKIGLLKDVVDQHSHTISSQGSKTDRQAKHIARLQASIQQLEAEVERLQLLLLPEVAPLLQQIHAAEAVMADEGMPAFISSLADAVANGGLQPRSALAEYIYCVARSAGRASANSMRFSKYSFAGAGSSNGSSGSGSSTGSSSQAHTAPSRLMDLLSYAALQRSGFSAMAALRGPGLEGPVWEQDRSMRSLFQHCNMLLPSETAIRQHIRSRQDDPDWQQGLSTRSAVAWYQRLRQTYGDHAPDVFLVALLVDATDFVPELQEVEVNGKVGLHMAMCCYCSGDACCSVGFVQGVVAVLRRFCANAIHMHDSAGGCRSSVLRKILNPLQCVSWYSQCTRLQCPDMHAILAHRRTDHLGW